MSRQIEEWRPVIGYEGLYEVSDWGRVKSIERYTDQRYSSKIVKRLVKGRIMKNTTNQYGYRVVTLTDENHNQKEGKVHQLVAKTFIPNPDNKPQVDHIIPIKNGGGDEVWNLRWSTQIENSNNPLSKDNMTGKQNGRQLNRPDQSKKVYQYLEGEFIAEYASVSEAERSLGVAKTSVSGAVRRGNKIKGYNFYYNRMETNMHTWTADDIKLVKKFIEIRNRGYYCSGQEVTDVHNRVLHTNLSSTSCGQCIRARISTLENALIQFEKLQEKVVEETEKKKEDDKPKKRNVRKKEE